VYISLPKPLSPEAVHIDVFRLCAGIDLSAQLGVWHTGRLLQGFFIDRSPGHPLTKRPWGSLDLETCKLRPSRIFIITKYTTVSLVRRPTRLLKHKTTFLQLSSVKVERWFLRTYMNNMHIFTIPSRFR